MPRTVRLSCFLVCALALGSATAAPAPHAPGIPNTPANWAQTLERIATGVVTIQIDSTRAFDTEWNTTAQATGFVIDAKRGLILTNRHVVTPGPVTAQAIFLNREEVPLFPVYRDPVHDFGIYRYDPAKLKFIQPAELPLYPAGAVIGREIRVVGNDAGEQLSILAGTLARLDREAPEYGYGKYNDFNTFYYQAASSTSGGSSGSPVIDIEGRVVALNAGGATGAASSFYLPLTAVVRALKYLEAGETVPRGTLETVFKYTPYDELRRLGLNADTEARIRSAYPRLTGMLVADDVLPGSAADGILSPGDILVAVDGKPIPEFFSLEDVLDAHVGQEVTVEVQRGRETLKHSIKVQSLDAITADEFIEFGEAVVHTLSYQQARHYNLPIKGVYVANPGYVFTSAGIPHAALISSFDGKKVDNLRDFENVLAGLSDGARVPVRYVTLEDPRAGQLKVIRMDRLWFPARKCKRDDKLGTWPCVAISPGPPPTPEKPASTQFAKTGDPRIDRLAPSLVMVTFDMPYSVSGVTEKNYHGTGVILDAQRGLVAIDRNTVPVAMGDVRITFAGTVEVPGKVVFIHPLHNLAVVSYDPKAIGTTPVRSATLLPRPLKSGDDVWVVGERADSKIQSQRTQVSSVDAVAFPLSRTLRFRDSNLEAVSLINPPGDYDGVLADEKGDVLALWSSFAYESARDVEQVNRGVPADLVAEMLGVVDEGKPLYSFEAEFDVQSLASARELGLPDEWVKRLEDHNPQRRQVLGIDRLVAGSPAADLLEPGDLVLAVDGKVVNRFREVETAVQKPEVTVSVWRDGAEKTLQMKTVALNGRDIDRVLIWAGATLQAPHRAMAAQRGIAPYGVFVSFFFYGSPATHYGLYAGRRITEVDGQPTADLDAFIRAVSGKGDHASLRLKTLSWNGITDVITLKLDKHYWPAYELQRQKDGTWVRTALDPTDVTASAEPEASRAANGGAP
ncbi:MAG TPA: trypsin-like peptidase domain-containing protein [Steroidobacteraceae bacterium]|jgi:S1-C subfamily serine protease|nr:trypsin-like peptidase domain-containing protein [Steroidobacteraceae bacterium]